MKDRSALVSLILLSLISLLALGLRLYGLDAQSLWYDEGFSVYLARLDLGEITARTAADIQPPLYYYLLHGWIRIFGGSERAVRALSLLFGVLTSPLIYAVAWQLFRSRLAGLLAALLVAVSPLHVWYGQEARMYTMLTFLCLLSSYLLLLAVQHTVEGKPRWLTLGLWVAYTLASVAALYTHYFALFVLIFQGLYLFLVWWERGLQPARLILAGSIAGLVTVLAYLPWLPFLLNRYSADVSYLPGRLKIDEVLLDITRSFVGGESVSEWISLPLSIGYGLVLLLCFVALVRHVPHSTTQSEPEELLQGAPAVTPISTAQYPRSNYPIPFLLLYLLIPPALILILAYATPKFNARYAMVSHPALLLIVAGGLAAFWQQDAHRWRTWLRWALASLALVYILGVSAYASYNIYADPNFARADFRGVVRYILRHTEPDETVILISGHMFPVFDYYAPDVERHLLPDSPTLDVSRTLDYSIAGDLDRWLAGKRGVWVVRWQDDIIDPVGYLDALLDEVGEPEAVKRDFYDVGLQHYRLTPDVELSTRPPIDHPTDYNFGDRLRLLGYSQTDGRQVTLFWQALQPLEEDYRVSLTLRDVEGHSWGRWDGRPSAYDYPTDRWRVGQTVPGRYDLTAVPGTPPGEYGLEVGVYTEEDPVGLDVLDQAGAPQGKGAMLGGVKLVAPATGSEVLEIPNPDQITVGGDLVLLGWDVDRDEGQPGDKLSLSSVWSAVAQPEEDYAVRLLVTDASGQTLDAGTYPPTNAWHDTRTWQAGEAWRGQLTFRLPVETQPGEARLGLQLVDAEGVPVASPVDLARIQVLSADRVFSAPQTQIPRLANFGNKVQLLGANLDSERAAPGRTLEVDLHWQALAEMDVPYTVFVHLLGPDGDLVAGQDGEPVDGTRPTTSWVPGEYIADPHEISVPTDLEPGAYTIEVGLYDSAIPGMPRLPILESGSETGQDHVIIAAIQLP